VVKLGFLNIRCLVLVGGMIAGPHFRSQGGGLLPWFWARVAGVEPLRTFAQGKGRAEGGLGATGDGAGLGWHGNGWMAIGDFLSLTPPDDRDGGKRGEKGRGFGRVAAGRGVGKR